MIETTKLALTTPYGRFEFSGAEVPEQINFGGAQMLCTHKMIGGLRIVDAMGPDDAPLSWNGIFLSDSASSRARTLDSIRRSGQVCTLTWGVFQYAVIVSQFKADFKKPYWIPFSLTCEVINDATQAGSNPSLTTPADAILQDVATVMHNATIIGDANLSGLALSVNAAMSSVTGAAQPIANGLQAIGTVSAQVGAQVGEIGQISTISSAASSAIGAATAPLAALQSGVQGMIVSAQKSIAAIPSLGQINATEPVAAQLKGLTTQCTAAVHLPVLLELASVATRMQANVALIANPLVNNRQVVGGGNLYQVASKTYGDATRWADVAQASGLADPMMTGFNAITVPA